MNLVILWSSDRGKLNRLKETNGAHRRPRRETGGSILRGQRETTKFAEDVRTRPGCQRFSELPKFLRSEPQTETVLRSSCD
jgi:hypothetical protein